MYFNPFRDFLKRILLGARTIRRSARLRSQSRSRHVARRDWRSFSLAAEVCEARMLLSGPQLIQVIPNTTPTTSINLTTVPANGTVETTAPNQLTLTFSPGASINPATVSAISVFRTGGQAGYTVPVQLGATPTVGTGSQANIVTLRFADSLPDDEYQLQITNALTDTSGSAFVPPSGTVQDVDFTVDFGAQVVSVVPQPVLRASLLTVTNSTASNASLNGATFTVTTVAAPVTFEFTNAVGGAAVPAGTVGISYHSTDTAAMLAAEIQSAINSSSLVTGGSLQSVAAPVAGTLTLNGASFSPVVNLSPTVLTVANASSANLNATTGTTFTVTPAGGSAVTFEFAKNGGSTVVPPTDVAIGFNTTDSATTLAGEIAAAINGSSLGANTVTQSGAGLTFNEAATVGSLTTPSGLLSVTQLAGVSLADGGLTQVSNAIVVYFNQDPLNAASVSNPAFYQVLNTTTGAILQPVSVNYHAAGDNAVLWFTSPIPTGTFHLTIGAPLETGSTVATAANVGTIFSNTGNFSTVGFIGDVGGTSSTNVNAVNLYAFQVGAAGSVTINASNLTQGLATSGNVQLTLFSVSGNTYTSLGSSTNDTLTVSGLTANTTYYLGVSSLGNSGYNPITGAGATGGSGIGSYNLTVSTTGAANINASNDTTSFATATQLGNLGTSGFTISNTIQALTNILYPALPGGAGTPGNRDLTTQGVSGESNAAGPSTPSKPDAIPVFYYNFQDDYGTVLGQQLHNQITAAQMQDIREILDMYGQYLGVEFVETASSGLTIATGDIRAVAPTDPPNAAAGIDEGQTEVVINAQAVAGDPSASYGGTYFGIAFHELGHALGLDHSYDAPGVMGTGVGNSGGESTISPGVTIPGVEGVFPGDVSLVAAENLNPPDSTDINLYQFTLTQSGTFSAQTLAQRLTLPATATYDFNTNGATELTFTANASGTGTGISLTFTNVDLGMSASPVVTVDGTQIFVQLNDDATGTTTASQLVAALNGNALASQLITASVSGGVAGNTGTVVVANSGITPTVSLVAAAAPSGLDTVLSLYSSASAQATAATPTFGSGATAAGVSFTAAAQGTAGNGVTISFASADLGAKVGPTVTVAGTQISVELNTDVMGFTTATSLANAINSNLLASELVTATATGTGAATTNITTSPISTLTLSGGVGSRTLIARNDDYFGTDSAIEDLHLAAGTYYVAVSSTGNTNFNPAIGDSGFGGRTDGAYQLQLNFTPDPAPNATLNDAGGVALDGDGQNSTGGTFNFWFQSGNTIFVDKDNNSNPLQTGSITDPYGEISSALIAAGAQAAADPGSIAIVRIEGNGGADGDLGSLGDDLPYLIGTSFLGNPEPDGTTFTIPAGVTVMVDAGAIIKLHAAAIDLGDTVPNLSRSGAALQVLGTPNNNVVLTSLYNNAVGGDSDTANHNAPSPADWGGIIFQQASDVQGLDWMGNGIFLDSVNQSNFTYGGGQLTIDSVLQVIQPIDISNPNANGPFFARPSIWFNTIQFSADAALAADPNSFYDSQDRTGPDVYGNTLVNNTINGLLIRVPQFAGQPTETLGVPARLTATDLVYVLTSNLLIDGNPGGPFEPDPSDPTHTGWDAGIAGSLVIDPGVIIKMSSSTIQAEIGSSQVIAEGTAADPIIFTSINDNSYGAGGTFQTSDNPNATPNPGDWGGIFFNSDSKGSINNAVISYAGGTVPIPGGFDAFNPVDIQQATVRIANTLFFDNAGGAAPDGLNGLQGTDAATIFVRGAQPVLVDNTFVDNAGYIISVNANALNDDLVPDWGDSTGLLDAVSVSYDNHGPLIFGNTEAGNTFNGMEVRAEEITTQTVWDDTDIVHIVTGEINDVINQHTFGGILLESNSNGSLVVKLAGAGAGFMINGIPLDIADRIGGALQILGTPNHPVVLTSLFDNTVGAGFTPSGQPQLVTDGAAGEPAPEPGDWQGITLGQYSNDNNVAVVSQVVGPNASVPINSTPATAQVLGTLAPDNTGDLESASDPQGGNDYQPVGFQVHGALFNPTDVNVYSFTATAGTEVWFQTGMTSPGLATVLELVDSQGNVLASSNASTGTNVLGGAALPMEKDPSLGGAYYSSNPFDTGFRVLLPGTSGTSSTYFIRVRSNDALTEGDYTLQVRLQQQWQSPGSSIQYANISYATNGIQLQGLPDNSPLTGTAVSNGNNSLANGTGNGLGVAQNIGNLLASDQDTLNIGGTLNSATQVDWYSFTLDYNLIQAISGINGSGKTLSAIFDVNYADGLSRPNTTISVYDSTGDLILISRNSNVNQPQPEQGGDLTNLQVASDGTGDPYIGPAQLPAGTPASNQSQFTYYVAVSSNEMLPQALGASFQLQSAGVATQANELVRLQPVTSIQRIVEDHIGFTGFTTGNVQQHANVDPATGAILPIDTIADLQASVAPYTLSDVVMYGVAGNNLNAYDPYTGAFEYTLGTLGTAANGIALKMRSDGVLYGYVGLPGGNVGQLVMINPATGAVTVVGNDNIPPVPNPPPNPIDPNDLTSNVVNSMVWVQTAVGQYQLFYAVQDSADGESWLYQANPANGSAAAGGGTPFGIVGQVSGSGVSGNFGFVTGMEAITNPTTMVTTLYGVSSGGYFFKFNSAPSAMLGGDENAGGPYDGGSRNTGITILNPTSPNAGLGLGGFAGLTLGPQNLASANALGVSNNNPGFYANMLFATTANGTMVALNTSGAVQGVFAPSGTPIAATPLATSATTTAGSITFSPLDFNLWHPTMSQSTAQGHGIVPAFDNSENTTWNINVGPTDDTTAGAVASTETQGGASFYFGLEPWAATPGNQTYFEYNSVDAQYGVESSGFQQSLTSNAAASGITNPTGANGLTGNYNLPGGASGSLVTQSFSLAGYSAGDLPTLYFTYLLSADAGNSSNPQAITDSARVEVSTNGGQTWTEVATNNLNLTTNTQPAELARYITPSISDNPTDPQAVVQPLYSSTTWQEARIDLSQFAGAGSVQLRFDFSTGGSLVSPITNSKASSNVDPGGSQFGVGPNNKATAANSQSSAGWYVDDLIVGLANRGEMVTGSTGDPANTQFFALPQNPQPNATKQNLTGPYQLEIRDAQQYGSIISGVSPDIVINQQFNDNTRFAQGFTITAPAGDSIDDGQNFSISDGVNTVTLVFEQSNIALPTSDQIVVYSPTDTNYTVAQEIRDAINTAEQAGKFLVTAENTDGTITGTASTDPVLNLYNAMAVSSLTSSNDMTVHLSAPQINETGGNNTTTGFVTINGPAPTAPLTINLSVANVAGGTNAATLSTTTVTIGAGNTTSNNFTISGDDTGFQGTTTVVVTPQNANYVPVSAPLDVVDVAPLDIPTLTFSGTAITNGNLTEGNNATITVTRNDVTSTTPAIVVNLSALDPTALSVPTSVTIPFGQASATFTISAISDGTPDPTGGRTDGLVAAALGYLPATAPISVLDDGKTTKVPVPNPTNVDVNPTNANDANGAVAIDPFYTATTDFHTNPAGPSTTAGYNADNNATAETTDTLVTFQAVGQSVTAATLNFTTKDLNESTLINVLNSADVTDGMTFTVSDGNNTVTYQFSLSSDSGSVASGEILADGNVSVQYTAAQLSSLSPIPATLLAGDIKQAIATSTTSAYSQINVLTSPPAGLNGTTFKVSDGAKTVTFEFSNSADVLTTKPSGQILADNNVSVGYTAADTQAAVATDIQTAIQARIGAVGPATLSSNLTVGVSNANVILHELSSGPVVNTSGLPVGFVTTNNNVNLLSSHLSTSVFNSSVILNAETFFTPAVNPGGLTSGFASVQSIANAPTVVQTSLSAFTVTLNTDAAGATPSPTTANQLVIAINGGVFNAALPTLAPSAAASLVTAFVSSNVANTGNVNITTPVATHGNSLSVSIAPAMFTASTTQNATGINASISTNSGASWTTHTFANGSDSLVASPGDLSQPQVAVDQFGNLFVVYASGTTAAPNAHIEVLESTNFGLTFNLISDLAPPTSGGGVFLPSVAAGDGTVYVAYGQQNPNPAAFVSTGPHLVEMGYSDPGLGSNGNLIALQQQNTIAVPSSPGRSGLEGAPSVAIDSTSHKVAIAFEKSIEGDVPFPTNAIYVATANTAAGLGTFGSPTKVTNTNIGGFTGPTDSGLGNPSLTNLLAESGIGAAPGLAWDPTTGASGTLYMVYTNVSNQYASNTGIYVAYSTNGGSTWNVPTINNPISKSGSTNILPRIAVDNFSGSATQGTVAVTWLSTMNDPTGSTVEEVAAVSTPATVTQGLAFGAPVQVSTGSSSAFFAGNDIDFGNYTGLAFQNGTFYPVWADNSGTVPNYTGSPHFDVTTDAVTLTAPSAAEFLTITPSFTSATDGSGNVTFTVQRLSGSTPLTSGSLTVNLSAIDELTGLAPVNLSGMPSTLTIANGNSTATFNATFSIPSVGGVNLAEIGQDVVFTAAKTGFESVSGSVKVTDPTTPELWLTPSSSAVNTGSTVTLTLHTNYINPAGLTVNLFSTDPGVATVPATVFIPANVLPTDLLPTSLQTATFTVTVPKSFAPAFTQVLNIVAAANGFTSSADSTGHTAETLTVTNLGSTQIFQYYAHQGDEGTVLTQFINGVTTTLKPTAYYLGDENTIVEQGRVEVENNTISNSQQYGIVVEPNPNQGAFTGGPVNLPTIDATRQVPGPNIVSNIINNFGTGGILFEGSTNSLETVPYGRIINNTIYGSNTTTVVGNITMTTPVGTGITVMNNAAPTLLNNIIADTATGIAVGNMTLLGDVSGSQTVIGTEIFQNDTNVGKINGAIQATMGTNGIYLTPTAALFANPANPAQDNFYLAEFSQAIDSAEASLGERPGLGQVLGTIGLPPSPIIAPGTDRFNQLRVDDSNVPNTGLGTPPFIDRGAVERADFTGPTAQLISPLDNGSDDGNAAVGNVFITDPTGPLTQFSIQLSDVGIGVNNATVTSSAFTLTSNGTTLKNGVDYIFVYNANTHIVSFDSTSVFSPKNTYVITLNTSAIQDLAGNDLQANQKNGTCTFTITSNFAPTLTFVNSINSFENQALSIPYSLLAPPNSDLSVAPGAGHVADFMITSIPAGVTLMIDGNPAGVGTIITSSDTLTWTPPHNFIGSETLFSVVGYDPANAGFGPSLSQSPFAVPVVVDVVPRPPTMSSFTYGTSVNENEPSPSSSITITFAQLSTFVQTGGASAPYQDLDGNPPASFTIQSVLSGTVEINGTPITAPATLSAGQTLTWIPPLYKNGVVGAFTLTANDGQANSSPAATVSFTVNAEASNPLLPNSFVYNPSPAAQAPMQSPYAITFGNLLAQATAQGGLSDPDGHNLNTMEFEITGVTNGSLTLNGTAVTLPFVFTSSTAGTLAWTSPAETSAATVAAFQVKAFDPAEPAAEQLSTPAVTVSVRVLNQVSPTYNPTSTSPSVSFTGLVNVPTSITYANFLAQAQLAPPSGAGLKWQGSGGASPDGIGFVIESALPGVTLMQGTTPVTIVPGTTVFQAGETLTWTSPTTGPSTVSGVVTVLPKDLVNGYTAVSNLSANVTLQNVAPTIAAATLAGATQKTPFVITYNTLLGSTNAHDGNNFPLYFTVNAVTTANGTLTYTNGTTHTTTTIPAGGSATIHVSLGDWLTWTPVSTLTAGVKPAFTVTAFTVPTTTTPATPVLKSATVQVSINVVALGSQFSLSGVWVAAGGLATITQSGATLSITNQLGKTATAKFATGSTITVNSSGNNIGFTSGTIDTSTADEGRITWNNGTVWQRLQLAGQYVVTGVSGVPNGTVASISQTLTTLTFTASASVTSTGTVMSPSQVRATNFGSSVGTIVGNVINFTNGQVWTKLDLPNLWTSSLGGNTQVLQQYNATTGAVTTVFVNRLGQQFTGTFTSATQVSVPGYGTGTIANGKITWSTGEVWTEALSIQGQKSGTTTAVSITATPTAITMTDGTNTFTVRLTSANTLVVIGVSAGSQFTTSTTGTRKNGSIVWSNNITWTNFDFNALDALFADVQAYPFV